MGASETRKGRWKNQCKVTSSSWLLLCGKQESWCNQINLGKNSCSIAVWRSGGWESWIPWPEEFGLQCAVPIGNAHTLSINVIKLQKQSLIKLSLSSVTAESGLDVRHLQQVFTALYYIYYFPFYIVKAQYYRF